MTIGIWNKHEYNKQGENYIKEAETAAAVSAFLL